MRTVEQALQAICERVQPFPREDVPLNVARERTLAGTVVAESDSPPFDKALMDGYALRASDTTAGEITLRVLETVTAGQVPSREISTGHAIRIMTGAPLPAGADAVVPVERTTTPGSDLVQISATVQAGANVLARGESLRRGEAVFAPGHRLRPQDLGLLAELGISQVPVRRRPRIAVLATGDELVPPDQTPGPGQIRNSNETLLVELARALDCDPIPLGIARDDPHDLREKIDQGLKCDLLLLSGGVSAGILDLVPAALRECGVVEVFHKVNLKPGKPIWFGTRPEPDRQGCLVFGLPGNPVSAFVCFELFARQAIHGLLGDVDRRPRVAPALLQEKIETRGDRVVYYPCELRFASDGRLNAHPVRWAGSGDLRATTRANGMVVINPNSDATPGTIVPAMLWSGNTAGMG